MRNHHKFTRKSHHHHIYCFTMRMRGGKKKPKQNAFIYFAIVIATFSKASFLFHLMRKNYVNKKSQLTSYGYRNIFIVNDNNNRRVHARCKHFPSIMSTIK